MQLARKRRRWFEDFELEILEPRILPTVVIPTSSSIPSLVAVGDFNGDGRPDVVDLDPDVGTASVYLNDPRSGTAPRSSFDAPIVISGLDDPSRVIAEDFNGDGRLDLAIASTGPDGEGIIGIYLGLGNGTFQAPEIIETGLGEAGGFIIGDFDGNGRADIAMPWEGDDTSSFDVLLNQGNGTFVPSPFNDPSGTAPGEIEGTGDGPNFLVSGDFNGDGKDDIVEEVGFRIYERTSLGGGRFTPIESTNLQDYGPINVVLGDFNGDGKLDIAYSTFGASNIPIFLGNGDGTFQDPTPLYNTSLFNTVPVVLAVGDFNGDGKDDVLASSDSGSYFGIAEGDAEGGFNLPNDYENTFIEPAEADDDGADNPYDALGDFNGDGKLDLVGGSPPTVLYGNGDGSLDDPLGADASLDGLTEAAATGDFNNDGKTDLAVLVGQTDVSLYPEEAAVGQSIDVFLGSGNGTLGQPIVIPLDGLPDAIAVGDFNGDGNLDLAVTVDNPTILYPYETPSDPNTLEIYLGLGDGAFQTRIEIPDGQGERSVATGDFNGDGKLDLVTVGEGQAAPMEFLGRGDGTFQSPVSIPAASIPASLTFSFGPRPATGYPVTGPGTSGVVAEGDFDGDGQPVEVVTGVETSVLGFPASGLQLVPTDPPDQSRPPALIMSPPVTPFDEPSTPTILAPDLGYGDDITAVLGHFFVPASYAGSTPTGYVAQVSWGDYTSSDAIIAPDPGQPAGTYLVIGSHGYDLPGDYPVTITLQPVGSGGETVASTMIDYSGFAGSTIHEGLYGRGVGQVLSGGFVTFGDPLPALPGGLTATIDWGDGTTTPATVGPVQDGVDYPILGGHIWSQPGLYQGTIRVSSALGLLATFHFTCEVSPSAATLTGRLNPSNQVPGIFRFIGTSAAGSAVTVLAYPLTASGESPIPIAIETTTTAKNGEWSITGPALPPGSYAIVGQENTPYLTGDVDFYGGPSKAPLVVGPPTVVIGPAPIAMPLIRPPVPTVPVFTPPPVVSKPTAPMRLIVPPRPPQLIIATPLSR